MKKIISLLMALLFLTFSLSFTQEVEKKVDWEKAYKELLNKYNKLYDKAPIWARMGMNKVEFDAMIDSTVDEMFREGIFSKEIKEEATNDAFDYSYWSNKSDYREDMDTWSDMLAQFLLKEINSEELIKWAEKEAEKSKKALEKAEGDFFWQNRHLEQDLNSLRMQEDDFFWDKMYLEEALFLMRMQMEGMRSDYLMLFPNYFYPGFSWPFYYWIWR